MYGRASNGPGAMVIFDVPDPAMAPAMCGVARISRYSTERRADAPLHDGRDRRHSAKGQANPRRLQAARPAVIILRAADYHPRLPVCPKGCLAASGYLAPARARMFN